jgi:predicted double-glycine peptidase
MPKTWCLASISPTGFDANSGIDYGKIEFHMQLLIAALTHRPVGLQASDIKKPRPPGVASPSTMNKLWKSLCCLLLVAPVLSVYPCLGQERSQDASTDTEGVLARRHTLKELRDRNVIKQQTDYSCGAAALATLMSYYFGDSTSEKDLLKQLQSGLSEDQAAIKKLYGFSLLDLKNVAQEEGYQAAGFHLTMEQLKRLVAPVIVFVMPGGYHHFAVLRGVSGGRVFLADPARGNLRMSMARFASEWDGTVFVLGKPGEENLTDFPLALPRGDYIQPELLWVERTAQRGLLTNSFVLRTKRP